MKDRQTYREIQTDRWVGSWNKMGEHSCQVVRIINVFNLPSTAVDIKGHNVCI